MEMTGVRITEAQRKLLLELVRRFIPGVTVWAYGSRVKGTARPTSDLDLVVFATPDQRSRVSELKEALDESNLPFIVDLHIWDEVPEQFHRIIRNQYVVLQSSGRDIMPLKGSAASSKRHHPADKMKAREARGRNAAQEGHSHP